MKKKYRIWRPNLSPTHFIILGFLVAISLGTILLSLPIASNNYQSVGFINALFTATSAVCVTGFTVVNTAAQWSLFGKIIILILVQFGGLGFMTCTTAVFIMIGKKITLRERILIQESLNQNTLSGMVRLIKRILLGTLIIEAIGALFMAFRFIPHYGMSKGLWLSIFHAVNAFCNAGFDILGETSLMPYVGDITMNLVVMLLIVIGGIGYTVWFEVIQGIRDKINHHKPFRKIFDKFTLHTKLVLVITSILVGGGFLFFLIVEFNNPNTLGGLPIGTKLLAAMFQSISPRTAGYYTIPVEGLTSASLFMTIILMVIGGSPSGTAGGVKTVTIGVLLLTVLSVIKGKERTEAFHRTISIDTVKRALAVLTISLGLLITTTMVLSLTEDASFMEVFFEAAAAYGTTGLSLGLTHDLSIIGKVTIAIMMFIGRLGPITMALAFAIRRKNTKTLIKLPDEKIIVG